MVFKVLLLLISIVSFLLAGFITGGKEEIGLLIIKFFTLFISFISLTAFFINSQRFQKILDERLVKRVTIILFLIGSVFYLTMSFLLNGKDTNYIVSEALDAIGYFIQARIFSTGHINVPSHELKEFFSTGYFINDGKYFSKYFPGWPLILSIGVILKVPWIINPLFGLLTLIIIYLIGREIYDRNTGIFGAVLLLFSFNFYILTPTYMSEPSSLFFSSLFFYLMVRTLKEPKILTLLLAGLSLGITFLIRPVSALAISLPFIIYLFFSFIKNKKPLLPFIVIVLTFLPALFVFFMYNYFQTGSIFLNPMQYYNPSDTIGFGLRSMDIFLKERFYTPLDGLKNMSINLTILNWESVLFLFIFLSFTLINKKNKWDILLFVTLFTIIFLHMFYFVRSIRYYYPAFFALFLLAARGINLSEISFAKIFPKRPIKNLNYLFLLFIVVANTFIIISPKRILQRYELYEQLRDPFTMAQKNNLSNSVVFLKTVPERYNNISYYVQNPLDFTGDVLFVRDLKEENIKLMEYYPERKFYTYEFDRKSKTGKLTRLNKP